MSDLSSWLTEIGLARYTAVFDDNDIDLDLLPELNDQDFAALGVSIGHRKSIMRALKAKTDEAADSNKTSEEVTAGGHVEAEHRQLTVMFCDLAGSTAMSEQLDAEDFREVILAYQEVCSGEIERFGGFIARYLGDGILAYFGYPRAHEDDAERSVRAGLGIVMAMKKLQSEVGTPRDIQLGVRIGISTGPVVVGDIVGEGAAQEKTALGEIPNIAARLQNVAQPGEVIIGSGTRHLVEGLFGLDSLGPQTLKGISVPVPAWRVIGESDVASRFEAAATRGLTTLAGRDAEINLILQRWQQAMVAEAQVVVLVAEAGVGKSRIVQEIKDSLSDSAPNRVLYFCSPHYQHSALHPALEQLRRVLGVGAGDPSKRTLHKLEQLLDLLEYSGQDAISLLSEALALPQSAYPTLDLGPQQRKERLLNTLVDVIECMSRQSPVLMVVEDLQWIDPTTSSLIELLVERLRHARLLLLVTTRPELTVPWRYFANITTLSLNHLGLEHSRDIVRELAGERVLEPQIVGQILARTDGVPLFVEELTKVVLDTVPQTAGKEGAVQPPLLAIPSSLQDSLMARLDLLGEARELAQIASVLGRRFEYQLLASVCGYEEATLSRLLTRLQEEGLFLRSGQPPAALYQFRQMLIQDTAYQSLLRSSRQRYHRIAATVLLQQFPDAVETEPEVIAHHFTEAAMAGEAIPYWHRAARMSFERSANHEAISHLERGLELVATLPDSRVSGRLELDLRLTLGGALGIIRGWAAKEVGRNYVRARELCKIHGNDLERFTVDWGLWLYNQQGGRMKEAKELATQILTLADKLPDSDYRLQAHHAAWTTAERTADFATGLFHAERGLQIYERSKHSHHAYIFGGHDPGVCAAMHLSSSRAELGLVDQALDSINLGRKLAADITDPVSQALLHFYATKLYQVRGEAGKCLAQADDLIEVSTDYGITLLAAQGRVMRGWAMAFGGDVDTGIETLLEGLAAIEATGSRVRKPYFLTLLAALFQDAGRLEEARDAIRSAREALDSSGERTYEVDLIRVEGELQCASGSFDTGVESLQCAIRLARDRQAKGPELRAATSLARIWAGQGDVKRARELLVPIYASVTEGLETRDPVAARKLLQELEA